MRNGRFSLRLFGVAAALLLFATVVLYPHFCDAVDPDGTSYLTLARRWAHGDWAHAVNGYWSPWGPWLTALGLRAGLSEIPAALVQNALGAVAFLGAALLLFSRLGIPRRRQVVYTAGLVGFLLYAVFVQWFDDLWAGAFLLLSLCILLYPQAGARKRFWLLHGLCGALAYFAKAYSLPFFVLNTAVCGWWLAGGKPGRWLALVAGSGAVLAACCLPWWAALHARYGIWTTGTAGPLNLSWGLLGHPIYVDGPQRLMPPPYPGSLLFWEDPWLVNARTVHFWDSPQLAMQQVIRCGYFTARLFWKASLVSPALPLLALLSVWALVKKDIRKGLSPASRVLAAQIVLFPLGLFLVHSESRYLWYLVPVAMAVGEKGITSRKQAGGLAFLLALSFWGEPLLGFPQLWYAGRAEKALATRLKKAGLQEGFAASGPGEPAYAVCCRIAYFSGVPYWAGAKDCHSPDVVARDMQRRGLRFRLTGAAAPRLLFPGEAVLYADRTVVLYGRMPAVCKR